MIIDRHIANALHADIILSNTNTPYNFIGNHGIIVNNATRHNSYIGYFYDAVEALRQEEYYHDLTVPILESRLWIMDPNYPNVDPRTEAHTIINNHNNNHE